MTIMGTKKQLLGDRTADVWNSEHPVGTAVRYWPILPPISSAPPIDTITRTPAWALGNGVIVVSIVGKTGGVSLSHIEVLQPKGE